MHIFVFLPLPCTWGLFFWPPDIFLLWFLLISANRFLVHFQITCMHWQSHLSGRFLFLSAFVIAASPTKKDSKTYFPEQAGSGTHYHSPEDILCSTLGHKSQSPEDICINEEHLDNLRGTSNTTQPAGNSWPTGVEGWSRPQPTGITTRAPEEENGIWLDTARAAKAEKPPKIFKKSIKPPETTASTLVPATTSQRS